jgi:hypothetical protein
VCVCAAWMMQVTHAFGVGYSDCTVIAVLSG